jgi:hypothetical protein
MKSIVLLSLLSVLPLHAEETPAVDITARRESVVNLKKHIDAREQRFQEIVADIRALDQRNEARIDLIIDMLKPLEDSQDTNTRINMLKADVIEGLRKSINIYQSKRRDIFERLRTDPSAPAQALKGDMEKIDERVQKRVDQILELAKSMPARKEVEKYESDGGAYWNGWYQETTRISEEYKQNRRQGVATEKNLRELREALENAISSLEAKQSSIAGLLKDRKLTDATRQLQEEELGRTSAILEHRRSERLDLAVPAVENSGDSASSASESSSSTPDLSAKDSAEEMKDLLEDSRKDIAADFWTVIRKYGEAAREREKILSLKANLVAREKWLAEHDAPAK